MGSNHARVLAGLEGVEFVGVFDPAPNVPDQVFERPVIRDLDEFLELRLSYAVVPAPTIYQSDMGTRLADGLERRL